MGADDLGRKKQEHVKLLLEEGGISILRKIIALSGILLCVVAWFGAIFGPRELFLFGILAFFCPVLATLRLPKIPDGPAIRPATPFQTMLKRAGLTLGLAAFLCLVVLFSTARTAGVADTPAFERLDKYELNNHGAYTEVSRLRYIVVSASFSTGWVGAVMLFNISAFYRLMYNENLV